ncbi:site-specific integrase [Roseomonas genomospecies 6]|uniref:DUF4102 domain-containing protein n=1 Tax=Roseomonas genomospecies 6 TaxID=214106 RepID=A0A9W7NLD5_9PROT|nr:tyrosine-type recombinase/integrase [Roseomonas genomospecies 6]KAA0681998.1 DUF4102 domain-containing protein [Roseomonas genomospecies 6]
MAPPVRRKIRLTDAAVKKLPIGRSWDTEIGGFGVKVYASGKAQFILRYRGQQKQQREFRLGQVGVIGADEARSKAKILVGKIMEGSDPAWDRKVGLASARTFNEVIDRYLEWADGHHKETSLAEVRRYCRLHIRPRFGEFPVTSMSRGMVQQAYDKMRQGPHFRAKMIAWARSIWTWGEKRELVGDARNPFVIDVGVSKPRRSRVLTAEEYERLWAAIEKHRYRGAMKNVSLWAIEFMMLSPLRKTEVFRLRWENVDINRGIIRVVQHKTDQKDGALEVHISAPLKRLLKRMPRSCEWLFPTPDSATGHIMSLDRAWSQIRKDAGLLSDDRVTLHDLRRSWNSVGATLGYGPSVMGKVIGNSARVNERHYWHLQEAQRREVTGNVAEAIAGFANRNCRGNGETSSLEGRPPEPS